MTAVQPEGYDNYGTVATIEGAHTAPNLPPEYEAQKETHPAVQMPVIPGYEFVGSALTTGEGGDHEGASVPISLPSYEQAIDQAAPAPSVDSYNTLHVNEAQAREALLEEVDKRCCYGKGAANKLQFTNISTSYALHYTLETFTESRNTYWDHTFYMPGQPVDGPGLGATPMPWDIPCHAHEMFQDQVNILQLPHTSHIQRCPQCGGLCMVLCQSCQGSGRVMCTTCSGLGTSTRYEDGENRRVICATCSGSGRRLCGFCGSSGRVKCHSCSGFGQVRYYLALKVSFKNQLSERVITLGDFPDNQKLAKAEGYEQCRHEGPTIMPLSNHPNSDVRDVSQTLVDEAAASYQSMRILRQRQVLRSIPVSECRYNWKNKDNVFWVYGTDNRVELQDYPHSCCCCSRTTWWASICCCALEILLDAFVERSETPRSSRSSRSSDSGD